MHGFPSAFQLLREAKTVLFTFDDCEIEWLFNVRRKCASFYYGAFIFFMRHAVELDMTGFLLYRQSQFHACPDIGNIIPVIIHLDI